MKQQVKELLETANGVVEITISIDSNIWNYILYSCIIIILMLGYNIFLNLKSLEEKSNVEKN